VGEEDHLAERQLAVAREHARAAVLGERQPPVRTEGVLEDGTVLRDDLDRPAGQRVRERRYARRTVLGRPERTPDLLRRELRVLEAVHGYAHYHLVFPVLIVRRGVPVPRAGRPGELRVVLVAFIIGFAPRKMQTTAGRSSALEEAFESGTTVATAPEHDDEPRRIATRGHAFGTDLENGSLCRGRPRDWRTRARSRHA